MATQSLVDQMIKLCEDVTTSSIDEIVTNQNWGEINFEESKPDLERVFAIFNNLKILPVEMLPDDVLQEIVSHGTPVLTTVNSIKNFRVAQNDPVGQKNALVQNLRAHADQLYKTSHIYIPYLAYQKGDIQRNIESLTRTVTDATKLVDSTKAHISERNNEIENIIISAREASASVGVAHFTADFIAEATTQANVAKSWLAATVVLAVLTLLASVGFLFYSVSGLDGIHLIQLTTSKLIIMGTLLTATLWSGKLYKAAKHQESTNKHRANSLKTFQAFANAAFDDATRNAVLMEATKTIFSAAATGYIEESSRTAESGVKIVEIARNSAQTVAAVDKHS